MSLPRILIFFNNKAVGGGEGVFMPPVPVDERGLNMSNILKYASLDMEWYTLIHYHSLSDTMQYSVPYYTLSRLLQYQLFNKKLHDFEMSL